MVLVVISSWRAFLYRGDRVVRGSRIVGTEDACRGILAVYALRKRAWT
jgi:hypothetical protein